jgi:hypothetical protein
MPKSSYDQLHHHKGEEKDTITRITKKIAMQPHQKGHEPNDQGGARMTNIPHVPRFKGCAHTLGMKKTQMESSKKVSSRNPCPS